MNENISIEKDDLNQILDRNITWIENCDTKASVILGGVGVAIAIFLSSDYIIKIKQILTFMLSKGSLGAIYIFIAWISLVFIATGLFYLLKVLLAKINIKEFAERGLKNDSLIFFSSISQIKTFRDYIVKIKNCSEATLCDDIISQIYICAQICTAKFKNYKIGLILSITGFVLFSILLLIGVIVL